MLPNYNEQKYLFPFGLNNLNITVQAGMLCLTASAKPPPPPPFHSDAKYVQLFLYKIVIQKP